MDNLKYLIAGALAPFFWLVVLGGTLWAIRRFFPRAEAILFASPLTGLRRLWQAIRTSRRHRE